MIFLGDDIVYVKNNFSHATGSIAGMVSDDAGSKGRPQQIPLDEWCKENYGISAAGYYYRVRKVKEAYLDQVSEEKTSGKSSNRTQRTVS